MASRLEAASADGRADLRASDRERERVVDSLAQHAAEGRLTTEELETRIDAAHAALTRSQLAGLTSDLATVDAGEQSDSAARAEARGPWPDLASPLVVFVAVNLVLVAVWALGGGGYFWPAWPLLGWGLGLAKSGTCRRRVVGGRPSRQSTTALARRSGGDG